ncbi:MAG: stage II sporulation protein M, partial [Desulfobacterales bacterium]|nr:stage II sporulation protein M [Desulfobacterales bacterium]
MRQEHFEQQNRELWDEFNEIIKALEKVSLKRIQSKRALRLPFLYRQICNHYALSLSREYSPALVDYLHSMALEGHKYIYKYHNPLLSKIIEFLSMGFPKALRQNLIYFIIALLVFLLPALLTGYYCYQKHELIYSILDDDKVAQVEYMYDPTNRKVGRAESRSSATNIAMFGFYIKNNIGIGFRTFAGGILAGIGTLFFCKYSVKH